MISNSYSLVPPQLHVHCTQIISKHNANVVLAIICKNTVDEVCKSDDDIITPLWWGCFHCPTEMCQKHSILILSPSSNVYWDSRYCSVFDSVNEIWDKISPSIKLEIYKRSSQLQCVSKKCNKFKFSFDLHVFVLMSLERAKNKNKLGKGCCCRMEWLFKWKA